MSPPLEEVFSLQQAEQWFLNHSSGSVRCCDFGFTQTVSSYPEAEQFYERVRLIRESARQTENVEDPPDHAGPE